MIQREEARQTAAPRHRRIFGALLQFPAFEALRYREYRLLCSGQLFGSMGMWMDEVTRGWLIYELTNSAAQLGLVRGIQALPFLFLAPLAGSAADRYSRKKQLMAAQVGTGVIYAATALLVLTGRIRPWHVYVTAVLVAVFQVFQQPARAVMVSEAVPPRNLTNAIGLNALLFNVSRSAGPALGGVLIALLGTGGAYSVQAVFFFLATLWTVQLRLAHRASRSAGGQSGRRESIGQSILEGWRFSWRNEPVRIGLMCTMIGSLFVAPFTTLLPVFARDLLEVGANGQGLLLTAMGIGAFCSAALIASAGDKLRRGMLMLGSVMFYGFLLMIFAASSWFTLSLLMMVLVGLCHVHFNALVQTVIQSYSPPEFRGRTVALFTTNQVVVTVGSMLIGALSSFAGARWAVAIMGAIGSLAMITIFVKMPRARHIR